MALTPGTRLGPYEIVSLLGAGGMGEVYRARDSRLDRSVAIKVLPSDFARDEQLRERFTREAKTISQLNHPHICTLHDVGSEGDTSYLVMELIEGESLADRLAKGPLPLKDVLRYGAQIAEALDRAHRAGIIHRDLKPGNVMLTRGGAKLLDFGLARTAEKPIGPDAPTVQKPVTSAGMVVGTIPYMSPEQLHGAELDSRSDIFSLGVVLYEMITGERAFGASSQAGVISAILEHQPPPPSERHSLTPAALEHVVMTCLEKDADERFQSAADVALQLRWIAQSGTSSAVEAPRTTRRWYLPALVLIPALIAAAAWYLLPRPSSGPPAASFTGLTLDSGAETEPSISPDGKMFVFVKRVDGQKDIFLQRIEGRSAINLTNTPEHDDGEPAFSPDGSLIAFRSERDGGGIFVMGATGESVRRLTTLGHNPSWSPDGKELVFAEQRTVDPVYVYGIPNLHVVDVQTGVSRAFYEATDVLQPAWSPNGHRIAFWNATQGQRDLFTIDRDGSPASLVAVTSDVFIDWHPVWSADGKHLYFSSDRDGTMNLWRIPIDERSGEPQGEPEPLRTPSRDSRFFSLSPTGDRLIYQSTASHGTLFRVSFDPEREQVGSDNHAIFGGAVHVRHPAVSPDGRTIAFGVTGQQEDVYVMSSDGTNLRQLTNDIARDRGMSWWPDGSRILFYSNRDGTFQAWTIRPDGSGLTRISALESGLNFPLVSPDTKQLAFVPDAGGNSQVAELDDTLSITRSAAMPAPPRGRFVPRAWSPDGNWIVGAEYGQSGVFLYSVREKKFSELPGSSVLTFLDNERLAFADQQGRVGVVDLPALAIRVVGEIPAVAEGATPFAFSPDGRTILLYHRQVESDIWQMAFAGDATTR